MADDIDWCAQAVELRAAYLKVLKGQSVIWLQDENSRVQYSPANVEALRAALGDAEARCQAVSGKPRRFAMRAGSLRRYWE